MHDNALALREGNSRRGNGRASDNAHALAEISRLFNLPLKQSGQILTDISRLRKILLVRAACFREFGSMSGPLEATRRIMVVEDEFLIRLTLVEALTDEGFDVVEAESGDAALPLLEADPTIRVLLTDIQLPGSLNGTRLAQRARALRPDLPVLFMTGRPDPSAEAKASPLDRYIAKPYSLVDICKAVRALAT